MQNYKEYSNPEQKRIDDSFQRLKGKLKKVNFILLNHYE